MCGSTFWQLISRDGNTTTMEMPLVEIGPGEFCRMPSGRVVEGFAAADRKVIVGQFGPVEMPFVLRRIDAGWRVEVEPYSMHQPCGSQTGSTAGQVPLVEQL